MYLCMLITMPIHVHTLLYANYSDVLYVYVYVYKVVEVG